MLLFFNFFILIYYALKNRCGSATGAPFWNLAAVCPGEKLKCFLHALSHFVSPKLSFDGPDRIIKKVFEIYPYMCRHSPVTHLIDVLTKSLYRFHPHLIIFSSENDGDSRNLTYYIFVLFMIQIFSPFGKHLSANFTQFYHHPLQI